jgi:hypothetical protein
MRDLDLNLTIFGLALVIFSSTVYKAAVEVADPRWYVFVRWSTLLPHIGISMLVIGIAAVSIGLYIYCTTGEEKVSVSG